MGGRGKYMKKINFSKENLQKKMKRFGGFMKRHYVVFFKESLLLLCFILSALLNTFLLRLFTVHNITNIKPLLADLGMLFVFSSFACLFKTDKGRMRYLMVWSLLTVVLCVINSIYYSYYDSFVSVSLLATSAFVSDVSDAVVELAIGAKDFIYIWQPIFLFYVYTRLVKKDYFNKVRGNNRFNKKFSFVNMFATGCVILLIASAFMNSTDWSRFTKMWNRESVLSSFGVYTYQINDIAQSLEPKINNLFGHDKALKNVKDYYENNSYEDTKNEYTGIFEGKNVIVIHAESLQTIAMEASFNGQEVTPNLNKLAKEGIMFHNFYSQVGVGTSSDAEFTFSTSLMPSSSGTVFVNYFDREYVTIQNLFKEKGYYTFSMHANTGDFWNRATMHKNMGYDDFYSKSSFEIDETIGLGLSDKSFFRQVVPMLRDIINEKQKPFYATLIMLTNHTPFSDLDLMDEYSTTMTVNIDGEEVVRDYINGTTLGNYFRSVHYADQAIGQLIEDLDKEGLLDNTVLVIYGDHDARIKRNYYNIYYNYDPYTDSVKTKEDEGYVDYNEYEYLLDKSVPFIIWTKDNKYKASVDTPTGMIDVLPTLGNMFNLHSDFQLGHDIFSIKDGSNTVVFTDGSYLTDKIYYNGQNGEIYSINGDTVTEEYIDINSKYASDLIDVSNDIITYDLIKEIREKGEK